MLNFKELFVASYKELKNLRSLTLAAMLGAVSIVLGMLAVFPTPSVKVTFAFLPNEFVYYLFGPVLGAAYGAILDILTYIVKPMGAFFPGLTLSAVLTGLLYGIFLYKRPLSIRRIFVVNVISTVFISILLNTYWMSVLRGTSFMVELPFRAIKAIVMLPIETIMLYVLVKGVEATGILKGFHNRSQKLS